MGEVDSTSLLPEQNPEATITPADFKTNGMIAASKELALVVQSARQARAYISNKQWTLLWRDADLLYQSPRPLSVYENTYILEPNVQRFTVAKVCNSVVPQIYKGLFYDDPPMILRPRPGTSQKITDAKTALFSYILDACKFKTHTKWGLEQMAHLGTGIWKWGYDWQEIVIRTRKATNVKLESDDSDPVAQVTTIPTDEPPIITEKRVSVPLPFFEFRAIDRVLVDPQLEHSDITHAAWVVDVRHMDYYQLDELKTAIEKARNQLKEGETSEQLDNWNFPTQTEMDQLWNGVQQTTDALETDNSTYIQGVVHHAERMNLKVSPDPRRTKLEILEYWDKGQRIMVLNQTKVIYKGKNEFNRIPFLSANWWNRAKAFYGMGLGLIVGQNQRVDQGTINAILKILSFGVNPLYLRDRNDNAPTQMLRTGLGKILTVTNTETSYRLMETPKVPSDVWAALKESEQATESSSGADQMLVQGSSAGPRSSMGRTSGGANILAGASATRLDGPLDNFIEQVFKPFLYIVDWVIFNVMSDQAILHVLGQEMGTDLTKSLNMQEFHSSEHEYEVLAGASLAAKRTMAQSMVMLTQILDNPQIQQSLADINEEYIDFKPIIKMWMEASEWKNGQDIVRPFTAQMKAKRDAQSKSAMMQQQLAAKQQADSAKFAQKEQLSRQEADQRIERDLVVNAARNDAESETDEGVPSTTGLQGQLPNVA